MLEKLLERLMELARQRKVVRGRRLRVDTTVVETRIHYPTDRALLADGVRTLTRTMARLRARLGRLQFASAIGPAASRDAPSPSPSGAGRRRCAARR